MDMLHYEYGHDTIQVFKTAEEVAQVGAQVDIREYMTA